ncbi:MAG TPA: ATP-binding protein [Polyangiaceae bacterium]|jgi:PAS domain S-box-containing protein|nr:ATP-binding protein [Polyangiaceae bacterium]
MPSLHALRDTATDDFRAIVDECSTGIIVQQHERVAYVNRAALDCLGFRDNAEAAGRPIAELLEPSAYETLAPNFRKANAGDDQFFVGDLKFLRKSGAIIEAEVYHIGTRFCGEDATIINLRDVTATKRMEGELRQAQKLEAVGRLAAGIAHEINTPIQYIGDSAKYLASLIGETLQLLEGSRAELRRLAEQRGDTVAVEQLHAEDEAADLEYARLEGPRSAARIIDGVSRVARIVLAMKAFSHPGVDTPVPMDLNKMLDDTVVIAGHEIKDIATVVAEFAALPAVHCYPGDLNQAFLNLIVNAAHAIADRPEKNEPGTITLSTRLEGNFVEVRISDDGCGMTPEVQARLFEPFFTTKEVGRGTGQGLTLARAAIVDKHGGSMRFESAPGVGSTCVLRLPVQ